MPIQITDLDEFLGADKQVKLGGQRYVLPPDLPAELYLRINRHAASDASEFEMVQGLYNEILGLFRYKQPDLESLPISLSQLVTIVARVYGDASEEEQKPSAPPTRPSRSGGAAKRGTTRTKAKRSR